MWHLLLRKWLQTCNHLKTLFEFEQVQQMTNKKLLKQLMKIEIKNEFYEKRFSAAAVFSLKFCHSVRIRR